jgi:drug/metabolite transporter (DMT)-like permease
VVSLPSNPSGYSYFNWIMPDGNLSSIQFGALQALAGVLLLIGWAVFLRSTQRSLGNLGLVLAMALVATLAWLLIDYGLIKASSASAVTWIVLVCVAGVMAIGMSWSHVRRVMSGQVDVDDVDE